MKIACLLLMLACGCVKAEINKSAQELQRSFGVYRRATVPAPDYKEAGRKAVSDLGDEIEKNLAKIEEASR